MDFGWSWCDNVGSLVLTNVPLLCGMSTVSESVHVWGGKGYESSPALQLCCDSKMPLKHKEIIKIYQQNIIIKADFTDM